MTDESNGESGFEFVEKKSEDLEGNPAIPTLAISATMPTSVKTLESPTNFPTAKSILAAVTSPITVGTGNILSNIHPPSALPTFIANLVPTSSLLSKNDEMKTGSIETPTQSPDNAMEASQTTTSSYEEGPQILIAPDSPTRSPEVVPASLFTWVKDTVVNSNVLSKVAEKAKSSVNSMITTLDPQMREFIYSGGDIEIAVASENHEEIAPIREAFQNVFGNATVNGINSEASIKVPQPVGFAAGKKLAQERIATIRKSSSIPDDIPVVAVENFLLEVEKDKWFDLGIVLLEDAKQNISLQTYTQMTPVPCPIVEEAQKDGFSIAISTLMGAHLQVPHTEWHYALTGVPKKDIVFLAAQSLAGIYKNTINPV